MTETTKKCPMCAEQIPADAVFCPYCGTHFGEDVQAAPPPAETIPPLPVSPAPLPARKSRAGLWIGGALILVIILGAIGTLLWIQHLNPPELSGLPATPTSMASPTLPATLAPTITLTPTSTPTPTPRPIATATPVPAWVTDFAQPILDAIVTRNPSFQDDFSAGSARWQAEDWCGRNMKYVEGELVVTDCRVSRPNINYTDFVIEFDARFLPGAASNSSWVFHFRDIGGGSHAIRIYNDGRVMISFDKSGGADNQYDREGVAHTGDQTNHILVIGKGPDFAIYLNNQPLLQYSTSYLTYGDFRFFADDTILAIDNIKVWNIYDLP